MTDYMGAMHVLSERLSEAALDKDNINDLITMAEWLREQNEAEAAAELRDLANYLNFMREELYKKGQNWLPVISTAEQLFRGEISKEEFKNTFEVAEKQSNNYREMIAYLRLGKRIQAIKLYRTIFRVGLKEAMEAITKLEQEIKL